MSHAQHPGKSTNKSKTPAKNMPYLSDVKLLPRMRRYIENKSSTDGLDVYSIVTFLQKTYPEYMRKKRTTFTHSVSRALSILTEELNISTSEDEGDVDILSAKRPKRQKQSDDKDSEEVANGSDQSFSDEAVYAEYQDSNAVNNLVTNLYNAQGGTQQRKSSVNEMSKKTGFVRCQSDPVLNKDMQLDGLGYLDRGPRTPLNSSKLIESMPASPLPSHADNLEVPLGGETKSSTKSKPVIITIGDDEEGSSVETPIKAPVSTPQQKERSSGSSPKKRRKPVVTKSKGMTQASAALPTPKKKGAVDAVYSTTKFSQIGGNEKTIEEVQKLLLHMRYPEIYQQIGVTPPRGFLLHGPPGCGKTLMAHAIAGELELPFFKLAATELVSGVSGESEERVRNLFHQAMAHAPCILFIDEVDSITPKRETASKDMERRIVSQFLTCLDELCEKKDSHVLVLGATNRPDSLDPALRRAGRFDREISMGIPDINARVSILRVLCKDIRLADDFNLASISQLTPGYVGADLNSLVREAAMSAVNRIFSSLESTVTSTLPQSSATPTTLHSSKEAVTSMNESASNLERSEVTNSTAEDKVEMEVDESVTESSTEPSAMQQSIPVQPSGITESLWKNLPAIPPEMLQSLHVTMNDFVEAVKIVQPSAKREGFATIPDVSWEDIGALKAIREELQMAILAPVKYPEQFKSLGLNSPSGVLLAGPPGCGKTLLAKAIANESGINFISVKGPELINMYVGESEKAVRQVFQRARNSSPCVVFFDELDSLCPRRSLSGGDGGSGSRIVNQLLTEMDGLQERKQVFIMGATNRPDIIDPAILRPGRLDKTLHVGVPSLEDRVDILNTITKNCTKPRIEGVDLAEIAALPQCNGFSGADLTAVVREASMAAMKEYISGELKTTTPSASTETPMIVLQRKHFDIALSKIKPSISAKDRAHYKAMSTG